MAVVSPVFVLPKIKIILLLVLQVVDVFAKSSYATVNTDENDSIHSYTHTHNKPVDFAL